MNMTYEYDVQGTNYADNVRDRIRSRSFYDEKKRIIEQKKIHKNRTLVKFMGKEEQSLSEPKVIAL